MAPPTDNKRNNNNKKTSLPTPRTPRTRATAAAEAMATGEAERGRGGTATRGGGAADGAGTATARGPPLPSHLRMRLNVDYHLNDTAHEFPVASSSFSTSGSDDDDSGAEEVVTPRRRAGAAARKGGAAADRSKAAAAPQKSHHHHHHHHAHEPFTRADWGNMALLVLLYAMQGIPLGLTMGALPFMLQSRLSYTQMGVFSVAAYPYSLKLLWSPLVDALYWRRLGRRKSWVVPVQLACACLLIASGGWIEQRYLLGEVVPLTVLFFFFVLLAATQDIAVDGWALTLLRPPHVEFAATCQTLGMNVGYFTSFTVFLALENASFCDTHLRPLLGWPLDPSRGVVTLSGYVRFWGWFFAAATAAIALFKKEGGAEEGEEEEGALALAAPTPAPPRPATPRGRRATATATTTPKRAGARGAQKKPAAAADWRAPVAAAYASLLGVVRLPSVWLLTSVLVTYRLGVLPAEGAGALKLLDKGASKEALAALVLVQFPVELLSALLAGRWAARASPHAPFLAGYAFRLLGAALLTLLVAAFPPGAQGFSEAAPWFTALALLGLLQSFSSTLMFTALGSFFNRVSDPAMGGAYLTLLNTIANMGVVLPKTPVFALIDALTVVRCHRRGGKAAGAASSGGPFAGGGSGWARAWGALGTWAGGGGQEYLALASSPLVPGNPRCPQKPREFGSASDACAAAAGECVVHADGFYLVSGVAVVGGVALLTLVHARLFRRLVGLPAESWRVGGGGGAGGGGKRAVAAAPSTPRTPRARKAK